MRIGSVVLCTPVRPPVDQALEWKGEEFQLGKQKVLTVMCAEMVQWYTAAPPLDVRDIVEVVERLTRSEGQPVDPKELEQFLGLVVKGCVPDGPPLQVAVFASVDVLKKCLRTSTPMTWTAHVPLFLASEPHGHRT